MSEGSRTKATNVFKKREPKLLLDDCKLQQIESLTPGHIREDGEGTVGFLEFVKYAREKFNLTGRYKNHLNNRYEVLAQSSKPMLQSFKEEMEQVRTYWDLKAKRPLPESNEESKRRSNCIGPGTKSCELHLRERLEINGTSISEELTRVRQALIAKEKDLDRIVSDILPHVMNRWTDTGALWTHRKRVQEGRKRPNEKTFQKHVVDPIFEGLFGKQGMDLKLDDFAQQVQKGTLQAGPFWRVLPDDANHHGDEESSCL
ncbi:hypothetical protein BGX31_002311 [Mortierella sp. GBA43]|nr:hypothetical protein BGX31_002311 [Mortierella sp. GBA43]